MPKSRYEYDVDEEEIDRDPAWLSLTAILLRLGVMVLVALAALYLMREMRDFDLTKILGSFGKDMNIRVFLIGAYFILIMPIPITSAFFRPKIQVIVSGIVFVLASLLTACLLMANFLL